MAVSFTMKAFRDKTSVRAKAKRVMNAFRRHLANRGAHLLPESDNWVASLSGSEWLPFVVSKQSIDYICL